MTEEERVQVERQRNTRVFQGVLALVGVLIVVSLNFWYTAHSQSQNDQKWCSLMVSLDDRYQALPQDANPDAKIFAEQVHNLRRDLHCKPSIKVKGKNG